MTQVKINTLTAVDGDDLTGAEWFAIWSTQGDTRKASLSGIKTYLQDTFATPDFTTQAVAPLAGATILVTDTGNSIYLRLTPAGTIATLTITLPPVASAVDGQEVMCSSTQEVTALTVQGNGASLSGNRTAMAAATDPWTMRFSRDTITWYLVS